MIAVTKQKHVGYKKIDATNLLIGARRSLERLPVEDRELLEKMPAEPVSFVDNPMFHDSHSSNDLAYSYETTDREIIHSEAQLLPIDIFDEETISSKRFKPLSSELETQLFLLFNFARFQIFRLVKSRANKPLTISMAPEIVRWKKKELTVRSQIAQANIPLVLAMAKRTRLIGVDFSELISEGNMALLRSIDKFDCSRGFKFSTYACRAILKSFSRVALRTNRYRGRFPVEFDPELEKSTHIDQRREDTKIHCVDRLRDVLGETGTDLTDVERQVLKHRFAITEDVNLDEKPMTLEDVGRVIGVTKERVRQIQNKALIKLRHLLEENVLSG